MIVATNEAFGKRETRLAHLQVGEWPLNEGVAICGDHTFTNDEYMWSALPTSETAMMYMRRQHWVLCINCLLAWVASP